MAGFTLPSRIGSYLLRLEREYDRTGEGTRQEIIQNCRVLVVEETDYDGIDGGVYGHDVRLYVPMDIHCQVPIKELSSVAEAIRTDLNELARQVSNEWFRNVDLAVDDENDAEFHRATPFTSRPPVNPETLSIWKQGLVRVFISHRDAHKAAANQLAEALETFGISCFVAHDTIEPMKKWRKEILNGLATMEVMLLFLTDDFESTFTNQEVGFALGNPTPIISLKLGKLPPPGFVNDDQAASGRIDQPLASAQRLYPLIAKAVGREERLQEAMVSSFIASPDWNEARDRFDRLKKVTKHLNDDQLRAIIDGFYQNDQLHGAAYLVNQNARLRKFLERVTGQEFEIEGRIIRQSAQASPFPDDDVPF